MNTKYFFEKDFDDHSKVDKNPANFPWSMDNSSDPEHPALHYLPTLSQLVKSCNFVPDGTVLSDDQGINNQFDCIIATQPLVTVLERGKCYTYFTNVRGDMSALKDVAFDGGRKNELYVMKFQHFPYIRLHFNSLWNFTPNIPSDKLMDERDHLRYGDHNQDGVFVALHDPDKPPSMIEHPFQRVKPGKWLDIQFVKKVEQWNPEDVGRVFSVRKCWPYNTKVSFDSDGLHYATKAISHRMVFHNHSHNSFDPRDLSQYRSRGQCFLQCLFMQPDYLSMHKGNSCINYYALMPAYFNRELVERFRDLKHDFYAQRNITKKISPEEIFVPACPECEEQLAAYNEMRARCMRICLKNCTEHTFYPENVYEVRNMPAGSKTEAIVDIEWSTGLLTFIRHKDRMCMPSFLGALGGHAHVWLGVSVISMLTFLVRLLRSGCNLLKMDSAGHGCWHFIFLWLRACCGTRPLGGKLH